MIKVCWIIDDLGLGGAQRQLVELAKVFKNSEVKLEVISLSTVKTDYATEIRSLGIPLTLIAQKGKWSWKTFGELSDKLKSIGPDIVQTWLFTADLYGRLAALRTGIHKIVSSIRNTTDDMPWHYRLVNRVLARWTSVVTINAEITRKALLRQVGIPGSKIRTIYNGMNLAAFPHPSLNGSYFKEWRIPAGAKIAAMAARMAPQKDYFTLVRAAKIVAEKIPNVYFLIIGEGPLRPQIEKLLQELRLTDRFRLLGARRDVWNILNHIDLFVLATHFEGCSNVIMEAMTASKPVVATRIGGNPELIDHEKNGLLTAENDADDLAACILDLLVHPDKAAQFGREGRRRVENSFTIERTAAQFESLYRELVGRRN